jgi:ketosteroid isomerase-like protein
MMHRLKVSASVRGVIRVMSILSLAACAACAPESNSPGDVTSDNAAMLAAVDSTSSQLTAAALRGDVSAVLAEMADDYVSLEDPGRAVAKPAYQTFLEDMMTKGQYTELVYEPLSKRISGDIAVHHGHWRMTYAPKGGEPDSVKGNYMHVYRRQADGAWKLATEISNAEPAR